MNKKILSILFILICIFSISCANVQAATDTVNLQIGNVNAKVNTRSTEYDVERSEKITISTTDTTVTKIAYQVGEKAERSSVTVNGRTATFTLPSDLKNGSFSLQVSVYHSSSGWGTVQTYCLNMVNPAFVLKMSGSEVKENTTTTLYEVTAGQKLDIEAIPSTSISHIGYKFGKLDYVQVSGYETQITIPQNGEVNSNGFELQVSAYDQTTGSWLAKKSYFFKIFKPVIYVTYNGNKLNNDAISTAQEVKAGDKILVTSNLMSIIDTIKYKFEGQTEKTVSCKGTGTTLTIPTGYAGDKTFSLNISGRGINGVWMVDRTVYFKMKETNNLLTKANLTVKIDDEILKEKVKYDIEEGKKIIITAEPNDDVKCIYYKFNTADNEVINGSTATIEIPTKYTNTQETKLQVVEQYKDNTYGTVKIYYLNVTKIEENIEYPIIVKEDEEINTEMSSLAISLRTIPTITKEGNQNFFKINENVQYNIDYINATGEKIDEKVYIYFNIPSNVTATVIDLKGGMLVDNKTIKWEFNGLDKDEKGTIPLILKYTKISDESVVIKPYVEIKSDSKSDLSGVINLIFSDLNNKTNTNHMPYMYGDEGTNTFRPNEGINRAEVAAVLVRVFDIPLVKNYTVTYKDAETISQGRFVWAEQAIMTVTEYGLMEGYDDGEFKPGANVTKAQLITILARKIEIDNNSNDLFNVKDEPIKLFNNLSTVYSNYGYSRHWAAKFIAQMLRLNMLPHFANTIDGNVDLVITRGEVTKLIDLMLLRGPSSDNSSSNSITNKFIDVNSNTQYYEYIIEATANKHNSQYTQSGYEIMAK